ncbi:DUF2510 domain-containing protein [Georgenia satyanarayanai]|uniref:DUF2510 domain-containing protein n=1 Tax=Georgenia satyanarayanai TaxID=860221 RepID=UPI001D01AEB3|nr:DUF2510 domain-containing protein [Georgenia satyanarayanai]
MRILTSSAPADWYPDPHQAGSLRYWDGTTWTAHVRPADPQATPTQPPAAHEAHTPHQQRLRRDVRVCCTDR